MDSKKGPKRKCDSCKHVFYVISNKETKCPNCKKYSTEKI